MDDQVDASGTVAQQIIPQYQLKAQLQRPISPPQVNTQWQSKLDDGRFASKRLLLSTSSVLSLERKLVFT